MFTYKLLIYNFIRTIHLHTMFFKNILSYYFIDLCQILNQLKFDRQNLLIYKNY